MIGSHAIMIILVWNQTVCLSKISIIKFSNILKIPVAPLNDIISFAIIWV